MSLKILFLNIFLLPIYPDNFKPTVVGLFLLVSIYYSIKNKRESKKLTKEVIKVFVSNTLIFIMLSVSLLYSHNMDHGVEYLIRVSPLLIFPVAFLLIRSNKEIYSAKIFFIGRLLFYFSTLIFFITIFLIFYWRGNVTENFILNYSYRVILDLGRYSIHPIYASLYIGIALILSINLLKHRRIRLIVIISNILLLLNLILLSRKSMIIIVTILFIIYIANTNKIRVKWKVVTFLSLLILTLTTIRFTPEISNRFKDIGNLVESNNTFSSSNLRVNIYRAAYKVIKEKPFYGHGIGDSKEALNKEENKQPFFKGENYNSHNQFLGFTLSTGLLGLAVFLILIFQNFKIAILFNNFEHLGILTVFISLMLIENVLDRQNGVILFSFYINYIVFYRILSKNK